MDTAWINALAGLMGAAVTAAVFVASIRGDVRMLEKAVDELKLELREALRDLRASRDKLGERIGELEKWQAVETSQVHDTRGDT